VNEINGRTAAMSIPTEDDWRSEPWDLDTESAYKHFHGKSIDESIPFFEENALHYQEDLMFMPSRAFGYYLRAYISYLLTAKARDDSDAASCFVSLIDFKAKEKPEDLGPLWSEIEPVLKMLADEQNLTDDWVFYGSLRSRIADIVARGFPVSFDTDLRELVPDSVTISRMAAFGGSRPVSMAIASQIFANSGLTEITDASTKEEILRILGPPDDSGGGQRFKSGVVPLWIRYNHAESVIRFELDGGRIKNVIFMPPETFDKKSVRSINW
jgi:hypothetical protein